MTYINELFANLTNSDSNNPDSSKSHTIIKIVTLSIVSLLALVVIIYVVIRIYTICCKNNNDRPSYCTSSEIEESNKREDFKQEEFGKTSINDNDEILLGNHNNTTNEFDDQANISSQDLVFRGTFGN